MSSQPTSYEVITQIIYRYARGLDRLDAALIRSCYHSDGIDSRPPLFEGDADAFVAWVVPVLGALEQSSHLIGNVLIDLDGNHAGVESYFVATLRTGGPDGSMEITRSGRYLDQFEQRSGRWAIARRMAVIDWSRTMHLPRSASVTTLPGTSGGVQHPTARCRADASYSVLHLLSGDQGGG